jgi:hypothetical protein
MLPGGLKEITTEWLNSALHGTGYLPEDVNITAITMAPIAVGEGFQSDMARITLAYSRSLPSLPRTMVAKLPTTFEAANYVAMLFNTYEREIRFYRELAKKSPMRTPGMIYGEFDAEQKRYVLILEDCVYCRQVDQVKGLSEAQLRQTVIKIADFHAHWWDSKELQAITWMPGPRSQAAYALVGFYRSCWDMAVQVPEFLSALPQGGKEAGLKIYEYYPWLVEDAAPYDNLTITHFDFRGDNLFFDESNPGDPVVVFDWQAASKYRGPIDVAYLVGGSVSVELRHKVEKEMLDLYYHRLLERGVKGYPFEECQRDYLGGLLLYAYIPVLAYSRLDISSERGKEIARTLTQRHFSAILDNNAIGFLPK